MGKSISVALNNHLEKFINETITSGKFVSVNEMVTYALQLLEKEENTKKQLLNLLEIGENSGIAENYCVEEHLVLLKNKHIK